MSEPIIILQPCNPATQKPVPIYYHPEYKSPGGVGAFTLDEDPKSDGWYLSEFYRHNAVSSDTVAGIRRMYMGQNRLRNIPDSELQRLIDLGRILYRALN